MPLDYELPAHLTDEDRRALSALAQLMHTICGREANLIVPNGKPPFFLGTEIPEGWDFKILYTDGEVPAGLRVGERFPLHNATFVIELTFQFRTVEEQEDEDEEDQYDYSDPDGEDDGENDGRPSVLLNAAFGSIVLLGGFREEHVFGAVEILRCLHPIAAADYLARRIGYTPPISTDDPVPPVVDEEVLLAPIKLLRHEVLAISRGELREMVEHCARAVIANS